MEYSITKSKRNNLILCASYIIIYYVYNGLSVLLTYIMRELDPIENEFINVLFLISSIYLYVVLIDYFRKTQLRTLEIVTIVFLISEAGIQMIKLVNAFKFVIPDLLTNFLGILAAINIVVWIVLVLRLKTGSYPALVSLRRYAFGIIAGFVLGVIIATVLIFNRLTGYFSLVFLPFAIPYIFIMDFALKLEIKEDNSENKQKF